MNAAAGDRAASQPMPAISPAGPARTTSIGASPEEPSAAVTLRPVALTDEQFLRKLYALGRQEELASLGWPEQTIRAFCDGQHAIRERIWRHTHPEAVDLLVVSDGAPVGRLCWVRNEETIRVIDLATVPAVAGRGIGTGVLRGLLAEADAAGLPVHLHVHTVSPARRLYQRLGFAPDESGPADGVYTAMTRPARITDG